MKRPGFLLGATPSTGSVRTHTAPTSMPTSMPTTLRHSTPLPPITSRGGITPRPQAQGKTTPIHLAPAPSSRPARPSGITTPRHLAPAPTTRKLPPIKATAGPSATAASGPAKPFPTTSKSSPQKSRQANGGGGGFYPTRSFKPRTFDPNDERYASQKALFKSNMVPGKGMSSTVKLGLGLAILLGVILLRS